MTSLCVLAHQDDEVALAPTIHAEALRNNPPHCIFLTNGRRPGVSPSTRDQESRAVLRRLGVPAHRVAFIGSRHDVPDSLLYQHLPRAYELALAHLNGERPDAVHCLSWEGGHVDHDASHLVALALAREFGLLASTDAFPIYNGYRTKGFLFRTASLISRQRTHLHSRFTFRAGLTYCSLLCAYPSQMRTWLGLGLGLALRFLVYRSMPSELVSLDAVRSRPHSGTLLYERLARIPYAEFSRFAAPFIESHLPLNPA